MKTQQRLTEAYESAKVIEFDNTSRYVWLSDAHRGDGSFSDEFMKNKNTFVAALDHYFAEGYTLIEAGDGDELWEFRAAHILKANAMVFERLRRFHTHGRYLRMFGNHDMEMSNPVYVHNHFQVAPHPLTGHPNRVLPGLVVHEAILLRHAATGAELLTVHGHQGDLPNDQNWRLTRFTFRLFWRRLHALGIRSPSSPVRNSFKRHKVERNFTKWIRQHHVPLICGHTHRERFPRADEVPYFNTGSCVFPGYITGLELSDGNLSLVSWRVEADERRYLRIVRRVLAGPRPVNDFWRRSHGPQAEPPLPD